MKGKLGLSIKLNIFFLLFFIAPCFGSELPLSYEYGCTVSNETLSLKTPPMAGYEIYELEERLLELGYDPGKVDGVFDQRTELAVKKFQQDQGLVVNGQVDSKVWASLAQETDRPASSQTPPPEGFVSLVINLDTNTLTVYSDQDIYKEYPVAIGKSDSPSPVGEWKIIQKSLNWGGGFGTRWLGLNVPWGIYGIHGTNKPWSIGQMASKGCFRMFNQDVEEIYPWVKYGTPVTVIGELKYLPWHRERDLKQGAIGSDVVALQLELKKEGFLWGTADGHFGPLTAIAIKYFQTLNGLNNDGVVEKNTKELLGL